MSTNVQSKFREVKKRDGRIASFDSSRILNVVVRAMKASAEGNILEDPQRVQEAVILGLNQKYEDKHIPSIEEIQDQVEETLILLDLPKTAKAYILYRHQRAEKRAKSQEVPERISTLASESRKYFSNPLSEFIYYRTYSRWIEDEGRRETWIETIDRYIDFMRENLGSKLTEPEYQEIRTTILEQKVMPSMRLLWAAGNAAKASNVAAYNCAYIAPARIEDLAEIMYLLMCGTGVGFSVESHVAQQFPLIHRQTGSQLPKFVIPDHKEGWCDAFKLGLKTWFAGNDIQFDYSQIRPAGSRLKTMGGRSSGPGPLHSLMDFSRSRILEHQGKRLRNIDLHDIICKIGEIVMMGGVRRSALISLSDLDDEEMRYAKTGNFFISDPHRSMANNSAVYVDRPTSTEFLTEWLALAKGGTGERGVFNRGALHQQLPARRWKAFQADWETCGTNPCGEIILKSKQFCNLTEVIARPEDTEESLIKKIKIATLVGTYQSTLTHFPYLSSEWKRNSEQERLLGVSITGQWDCPASRKSETLKKLKDVAIETNRRYADLFEIPHSTAITCVKPSGTVSQLVNSSSGMHPRHAPYYLRRIRISAMDPLFTLMKDQKFPYQPEVGQMEGHASVYVLEFPVRSPENSLVRNHLTALDQLEHWKQVKSLYTEHNPSVTVSVGPHEWIETANWLYNNWNLVGGLSFLPKNENVYQLAPFEEISEEEYEFRVKTLPVIDFAKITLYEHEDWTTGSKEMACVGGVCELDPEEGSAVVEHPHR